MGIVSDQDLHPFMRQKFTKWWAMTKLGWDGIMLERTQRQLKASEKLADIAIKGNTEGVDSLYPPGEEEDMAVSIGNETHTHYHYGVETVPPAPTPAPVVVPPVPDNTTNTTNTTTTTTTDKISKPLLPWILAVLFALSGISGWAYSIYTHNHPTPASVDTDSDNESDVIFPQ